MGERRIPEVYGLGMVKEGSTWSTMMHRVRAEKPEAVDDSEVAVEARAVKGEALIALRNCASCPLAVYSS